MKSVKIVNCKYDLKHDYYANDNGSIYSAISNKTLSYQLDKDGYAKVQLSSTDGKRHRYSVHRLILENFNPVENMQNLQVNHIDGNKLNNRLENLQWCNCSENQIHAYKIGLKNQVGDKNNASKLTEKQVLEIIDLLLSKQFTQKQIALRYGVCDDTIGAIKRKQNWKYLTENINFN